VKRWSRAEILIPLLWFMAAVGSLITSLYSLRHNDMDGLNYLFQIPLALPWPLLMPGVGLLLTDAQIAIAFFLMAVMNAALLCIFLRRHRLKLSAGNS